MSSMENKKRRVLGTEERDFWLNEYNVVKISPNMQLRYLKPFESSPEQDGYVVERVTNATQYRGTMTKKLGRFETESEAVDFIKNYIRKRESRRIRESMERVGLI